jgi:small subunit ribosomal protein S1
VESPREIVHPGDEIRVRILEIDSERRRLSLSAKRVEDQILPIARPGEPEGGSPAETDEDGEQTLTDAPDAESEAVAVEITDAVVVAPEAPAEEPEATTPEDAAVAETPADPEPEADATADVAEPQAEADAAAEGEETAPEAAVEPTQD